MIESLEQRSYSILLIPTVIIIVAVLLGLLLEYVLQNWLKRLAHKTSWISDELILDSLRGMALLWSALLGLYVASQSGPLIPTLAFRLLLQGLFIVFIISMMTVILRLSTGLTNLYSGRGDLPSVSILKNILRVIIVGVGLLFLLQSLGIPITPALAALGVGGLAVSLALQETLSNLFSGILLVLSNQIRPGNYVKLNSGEDGYVADINWHTTKIRQISNNMVIVPNSKMTSAIVTNYWDPEKELAVLLDIGVSYDSDLEQVERVTIEVARSVMQEVEGGVPEFVPLIRYHTFGDFSINFTVVLRGKEFTNQFLLKHEFVKRLHRRYNSEGIVIPYPIQTVHTSQAHYLAMLRSDEHNERYAQDQGEMRVTTRDDRHAPPSET